MEVEKRNVINNLFILARAMNAVDLLFNKMLLGATAAVRQAKRKEKK
jgi:hypothetical protein